MLKQNSETFNSKTLRHQPVNLSETSRCCQCVSKGSLLFTKFLMSHFFYNLGALKCSDKVIDSLFHTKCLDTHTNEKIIILKLALSG